MREVFVPISTNKFKKTLGSFATGVTVVTTCLDSKLHGLTVNAFSSLSLNPPLVLICIDKKSESNKILKQSKIFAVNILSKDQKNLSKIFPQLIIGSGAFPIKSYAEMLRVNDIYILMRF